MSTSRHREYAVDDRERPPTVDSTARLYAAALWALEQAQAKVEAARLALLAAVERGR